MEIHCCFPGCKVPVKRPHIACVIHWHKLPAADRKVVQERIQGWKNIDAAIEWAVDTFVQLMRERRESEGAQ